MTKDERLWLTIWGSAFAAIGAADFWRDTKHNGTTISELTRRLPNRLVGMAVGAAAGWYCVHIADPIERN